MAEISTKKTVDEQVLERLQALEVLLIEQRKEIDSLKIFALKVADHTYEFDGVNL